MRANCCKHLTKDPHFDWLHELSELMVYIDELLDEEQIANVDTRAVKSQLTAFMMPAADSAPSEFARRYMALLQTDPAVVIAHADVRRVSTSL